MSRSQVTDGTIAGSFFSRRWSAIRYDEFTSGQCNSVIPDDLEPHRFPAFLSGSGWRNELHAVDMQRVSHMGVTHIVKSRASAHV